MAIFISMYLSVYLSIHLSSYLSIDLLPFVLVCDVGGAEVHENGSLGRGVQGVDTSTNQ